MNRVLSVALGAAIGLGANICALAPASASTGDVELAFESVHVGDRPVAAAVSPDGRRAYVANSADSTMSVVDLSSMTVVATVPTVSVPSSVAVSPDGASVWVASGETWDWDVPVGYTVVDSRTLTTRTIDFIASTSLELTPDGTEVWQG